MGLVGKTLFRQASEKEKTYSAIIVHRLVDALAIEVIVGMTNR